MNSNEFEAIEISPPSSSFLRAVMRTLTPECGYRVLPFPIQGEAVIENFIIRVCPVSGPRHFPDFFVDNTTQPPSLRSYTYRGRNLLRAYSTVAHECVQDVINRVQHDRAGISVGSPDLF